MEDNTKKATFKGRKLGNSLEYKTFGDIIHNYQKNNPNEDIRNPKFLKELADNYVICKEYWIDPKDREKAEKDPNKEPLFTQYFDIKNEEALDVPFLAYWESKDKSLSFIKKTDFDNNIKANGLSNELLHGNIKSVNSLLIDINQKNELKQSRNSFMNDSMEESRLYSDIMNKPQNFVKFNYSNNSQYEIILKFDNQEKINEFKEAVKNNPDLRGSTINTISTDDKIKRDDYIKRLKKDFSQSAIILKQEPSETTKDFMIRAKNASFNKLKLDNEILNKESGNTDVPTRAFLTIPTTYIDSDSRKRVVQSVYIFPTRELRDLTHSLLTHNGIDAKPVSQHEPVTTDAILNNKLIRYPELNYINQISQGSDPKKYIESVINTLNHISTQSVQIKNIEGLEFLNNKERINSPKSESLVR